MITAVTQQEQETQQQTTESKKEDWRLTQRAAGACGFSDCLVKSPPCTLQLFSPVQ